MWTPEYYVRYLPLPAKVRAAVSPNDDGSFDIYINEGFDELGRETALRHELEHIRREHFYTEGAVAGKEAEASGVVLLSACRDGESCGGLMELLCRWFDRADPQTAERVIACGREVRRLNF